MAVVKREDIEEMQWHTLGRECHCPSASQSLEHFYMPEHYIKQGGEKLE